MGESPNEELYERLKRNLEGCQAWSETLEESNRILKKQLDDWIELFYLLKNDYDLLENFQTNDWMVKAREMGINI